MNFSPFVHAASHFLEIADVQQIIQLHFINLSVSCLASQQSYRKIVN